MYKSIPIWLYHAEDSGHRICIIRNKGRTPAIMQMVLEPEAETKQQDIGIYHFLFAQLFLIFMLISRNTNKINHIMPVDHSVHPAHPTHSVHPDLSVHPAHPVHPAGFILITVIFLCYTVIPSAASNPNPGVRVQVDHIAISVTNLSESEAFYGEIIGLEPITEPFGAGRHAWFDIGGAELHVIEAAEERRERDKSNHLCFSVSDLDAFKEHLTGNGVAYSDFAGNIGEVNVRPDGVRQIYLTDPDGYWIEVNDAL